MTAKQGCEGCGWRARYDRAPRSLLGRLWRWHARWCPGWKKYVGSLPAAEREALARRYGMRTR